MSKDIFKDLGFSPKKAAKLNLKCALMSYLGLDDINHPRSKSDDYSLGSLLNKIIDQGYDIKITVIKKRGSILRVEEVEE
jgi:hypothetical protein